MDQRSKNSRISPALRDQLSVNLAKLDLLLLDAAASAIGKEQQCRDPVIIEACKAIALAEMHSDVESRIKCATRAEVEQALGVIYIYSHTAVEQGTWNAEESGLELPNGSIVVVFIGEKRVKLVGVPG